MTIPDKARGTDTGIEGHAEARWQPLDLRAHWGRTPDLRYVIPGLVGWQEVGLLASETGAGKTHLLMNWAAALAGGKAVMGWCGATRPGRVAYVDREIGTGEFMRRLERLARAMGIPEELLYQNMMVFTLDCPVDNPLAGAPLSVDDPRSFLEFQNLMQGFAPDLIILDTFGGLYGGEENSNDGVRRWYGDVLVPMRARGSSIILAHHFNKGGQFVGTRPSLERIRGASDLGGFSDRVWALERGSSIALGDGLRRVEATLRNVKARRGDEHEELRVTIEDVRLAEGVGTRVTAIELAPGTHTEVVGSWLQEAGEGGLLRKEIVERWMEQQGLTHAAAEQATTRARAPLERLGHFRQVREGNGMRYFFDEHAPEEIRTSSD